MPRWYLVVIAVLPLAADAFTLRLHGEMFVTTPVYSEVTDFDITIEIDAPLAPGRFHNPPLSAVRYSVSGVLVPGTPSGEEQVMLTRTIGGEAFYAGGGSLRFEIAPEAALDDGLSVAELAGEALVLAFGAHETDTGLYHAPLVQLYADGSGLFANADSVVSVLPFIAIDIGEEYAAQLRFMPEALTIAAPATAAAVPLPPWTLCAGGGVLAGVGVAGIRRHARLLYCRP